MRLVVLLLFFQATAFAGANIPPLGDGEYFITLEHYSATKGFDQQSEKFDYAKNGKFSKLGLGYYWIHTIIPKVALIAAGTILGSLKYVDDSYNAKSTSMGDQRIGARYKFWDSGEFILAVQGLISFPLYSDKKDPLIGNQQNDLELRLLADKYQFFLIDFMTLELALVRRFDEPADQFKADFTIGENLGPFLGMFHMHYTQSFKNGSEFKVNSNPSLHADWDLFSMGPSIAFSYAKNRMIQLGYTSDIFGRNTSNGRRIYISFWNKY